MGKSSVSRAAIRYALDRHMFVDGAFWITATHSISFLQQIAKSIGTDFTDEDELIRLIKNDNIVFLIEDQDDSFCMNNQSLRLLLRILIETSNIKFIIERQCNNQETDMFKLVNEKDEGDWGQKSKNQGIDVLGQLYSQYSHFF